MRLRVALGALFALAIAARASAQDAGVPSVADAGTDAGPPSRTLAISVIDEHSTVVPAAAVTVWSGGRVLHLVTDASGCVTTEIAQGELYVAASKGDFEGVAQQLPGRYRRFPRNVSVTVVVGGPIELTGTVLDENNAPVAGASIDVVDALELGRTPRRGETLLWPRPARRPDTILSGDHFTRPDGTFAIRVRPQTRPIVLATAPGMATSYAIAQSAAAVHRDELHLRLHRGARLRAIVTRADGTPLARRMVALTPSNGGAGLWVATDDAGVLDIGTVLDEPGYEVTAVSGAPAVLVDPTPFPHDGTPARVVVHDGGVLALDLVSTLPLAYDVRVYACPQHTPRPQPCVDSTRVTLAPNNTARVLLSGLRAGGYRVWITGITGTSAPSLLVGAGYTEVLEGVTNTLTPSLAGLHRVAVSGPPSRFAADTAMLTDAGATVVLQRTPHTDWLIGGDVAGAEVAGRTRDAKGHQFGYQLQLGRTVPASVTVGPIH